MTSVPSPSPVRMRLPYSEHDRLRHIRTILGENTTAALAYAVAEFRWDAVERIIVEGGLSPDVVLNSAGQTGIVQCVLMKAIDGVSLFSRLGADLDATWRDVPLLHLAVMAGSSEVVAYLVNSGADVNVRDLTRGGITPMHVAALRGSRTLSYTLLRLGADMTLRDDEGYTASERWNEALMHPLQFAELVGVGLDNKQLFHWFTSLPSLSVDYGPPDDAVMIDRVRPWENPPPLKDGACTLVNEALPGHQTVKYVTPRHHFVADVNEVVAALKDAETFGLPFPPNEIVQRVNALAKTQLGKRWLTFDGFCSAVYRLAHEV